MYCHKCGSNNKEDARFCSTCSSELIIPTKEQNYYEKKQYLEQNNNSMKSLIIGICSFVFSFFVGILLLPLSICGIRLGIKSKDTNIGLIGLILNIVNILIEFFSTFIIIKIIVTLL